MSPKHETTRAGPPTCSVCNSVMEGWTRKWEDDNSLLWLCPNFCYIRDSPKNGCVDFPYLNQHIREDYPITTDAIDDWFKQCMEDFPEDNDYEDYFVTTPFREWFIKWFDQFKETTKK